MCKCKYHGIRFDPIHGDSVNIPFQKWKVRNNWDLSFFGDCTQLLIHDLTCIEWKLHSRFYENFYESLSFASLRWKFYFPRMYPNFWPNSSSDDRFNLWSKRYTLVLFHLFNKFSNEHNDPIVPMDRRTYD